MVTRIGVIGSACPRWLHPAGSSEHETAAELVLVVPDGAEENDAPWIASAATELVSILTADGLGYVLAGRRARRRIVAALRARGMVVSSSLLQLPESSSPRHLVPLEPRTLRYALNLLLPAGSSKRRLALALVATPIGRAVLARLLPRLALVVRRPSAEPLFEWLDRDSAAAPTPILTLGGGERPATSSVLHVDSAGRLAGVTKLGAGSGGDEALASEAAAHARFSPEARSAGAVVPDVLTAEIAGRSVLRIGAVEGRIAAAALFADPRRFVAVAGAIAAWLGTWNVATTVIAPLRRELLERAVLGPAGELGTWLDDDYRALLNDLCARLQNIEVPLVSTHGDLTMWNVILGSNERFAVLDWEHAEANGFPLVDFRYSVVDAAAAAARDFDRPLAFAACFGAAGRYRQIVERLEDDLVRRVGIPSELVALSGHACWLKHAANEHRAEPAGGPRPFLKVLSLFAATAMRRAVSL